MGAFSRALLLLSVAASSALAAESIPLDLVPTPAESSSQFVHHNHMGTRLTIPFATRSGDLLVHVDGEKLLVDANGNGQFEPTEEHSGQSVVANVEVMWGEQAVTFPVRIDKAPSFEMEPLKFTPLTFASFLCLQGEYAGKTLRIYDSNFTGQFGDYGDKYEYDGTTTGYSRMIALGDALFEPQLAGQKLTLTPFAATPARVTLAAEMPGDIQATVTLQHLHKRQFAEVTSGRHATVVPGRYLVQQVMLRGNDSYLYGSAAPKAKPMTLTAGEQTVQVGPPFKLEARAAYAGEMAQAYDVRIVGAAGEVYSFSPNRDGGDVFAIFVRAGEQEERLGDMEFG